MAIVTRPRPISPNLAGRISPSKKDEMQSFPYPGPIQLPPRFTTLKESLTSGREAPLISSWQRLLRNLSDEVDLVASLGSQIIPTITFEDITSPGQADRFLTDLRERGAGIIRSVVPRDTALAWSQETGEYLGYSSHAIREPAKHPQPLDVYWSGAQVRARAHPNVLAAQKFAMQIWRSRDPSARVTTDFPITYADRVRIWTSNTPGAAGKAHVDGGSVERWEPDGYGRAGTYEEIFQGRWEDYDPWESSTRLAVTSDLYHKAGACSIFRMFQGWLALDRIPSGQGSGSVQVCPLPRHATAYFLLRPFFSPSPRTSSQSSDNDNTEEWTFTRPQNSILHGALPSYAQEISPSLHPHLQLDRSLVCVPDLEPGDYLVWHPDLIHVVSDAASASTSSGNPGPNTTPARPSTTAVAAAAATAAATATTTKPRPMYMYLPACPLTQTNALYLCRQRKAFLLGFPGPDFGGGRGESEHPGRPGVQEVNDAGGDDGLRAMGLLPWDEEEADTDEEREVLAMANGILFPDLYDML
ncbi:hypothetical protein MFIFM68171_00493 [Madurella fahalii]|uniref:DUF1479-domain-containing protein n=1 Tax=Madurella fahalii TaxID=1157608 RepID=A0ABQ0FXQ9_9PEZI